MHKQALITALLMASALLASAKEKAPEEGVETMSTVTSGVVNLRPDDVTTSVAGRSTRTKGIQGNKTVSGFHSPQDTGTFPVNAPKADDYAISVIFSSPKQQTMEVRCGASVVTAPSLLKTWKDRPFYWRQELPGVLHLETGENLLPTLEGKSISRTCPIFWEWRGPEPEPDWWPRLAVRDGDWKLLLTEDAQRVELHNLKSDRAEDVAKNQSKDHPEIVARLTKLVTDWKATLPTKPDPTCVSPDAGAGK